MDLDVARRCCRHSVERLGFFILPVAECFGRIISRALAIRKSGTSAYAASRDSLISK